MFHPVWPGWPLSHSYVASEYASVVLVPSHLFTPFHNVVNEQPSPKENRKFLLESSVFDLVDAYKYLALTDPKLLGWYLCLSPEDRKIIQDEGGFHHFLQRHPALRLSRHHVYVNYSFACVLPAQSTMTSSWPTHVSQSTTSGATKSRSEISHTHLDMDMLPNKMSEALTLLGCTRCGDGSQKHPTAFNSPTTQEPNQQKANADSSHLNEQWPSWQMSSSSAAVSTSQTAMTQGQSDNYTYADVSPLQSEWSAFEKDLPPDYYSFNSTQVDGTEYSDGSIIQPVELPQVSSPLDPVEENGSKEGCQDHMVYGTEDTVKDDEDSSSFDQSDVFHSIMENDKSILVCLTSEDVKAFNSEVHSGPAAADSEAPAANSETLKSAQSVIKIITAEKYTSPMPCVTTCDMMVGTELAPSMSAVTQTEDPETADKHVITEVHMADLDYLAEEFIKLKTTQEEWREQKEKMKSLGCKSRKECECIQRAEQAELCLLALQYSMCRQHCWRLYFISAEGGQLTLMPKNPPANIASVLQKLESDFNQMRDKILAGVPLEQLKPLSVDSEKITTGASYIPAQIIGDVLGKVPSCSSREPQKHKASGEENRRPDDQSRNGCQLPQHSQGKEKEKQIKNVNSKARRAVTLVPQDRDAIHNAQKPEEKQTTAAGQELNTSEAWYDAEEDLEPAGAAETGEEPTVIAKAKTDESASDEVKSSVLCVSNLPSNVTESDVMLWFEKYHASEVNISALKNDFRVAIVMISGLQSAEAAVRELHGCCMQGHTLHVKHITRNTGGSQSQSQSQTSASVRGPESSQDANKPQTTKTDSSSTERKLMSQPPLSSSIKTRKVVCISPTAKGTFVPQHYGTMGSFDTLMAELTQRHPDVGRQRIVDALMELKAKHRGVLCGLPLRTIREMTSELLTRPASATQL
ncbi:RNA-binding protein 44 isoform X1 [Sebastes fasciatus]|uniref:RNA-binding protein 44 isoform X1 n=2 Tax=Sebastes fasciatus TaxID=394691 RepID=UPI003D9F6346